jgi:hypothetical protein
VVTRPPAGADDLVLAARADGVRGVLDDRHVRADRRADLGHRQREAGEVHGHHGARAVRERRLQRGRADIPGRGVDVGEARRRADVRGAVGARGERDRAREQLVALAEARGPGGGVQRGGAGGECDGVRRLDHPRELRLEGREGGTLGEPLAAEHVDDGLHVVLVD